MLPWNKIGEKIILKQWNSILACTEGNNNNNNNNKIEISFHPNK